MKQIDKKVIIIIISGIMLRLLLMFSSCHFDLLSHYWLAHRTVYHGIIPELQDGRIILTPIFFFHRLWLFIIRPLINRGQDFWPEAWFPQGDSMQVNFEAWQKFVSHPEVFKILFLLKFPYFIAELLMILFLFKLCASNTSKYRILNFLFFNPISLFIIYIFGAFDVIMLFFFVLSLFFIKKGRIYLGSIALSISIIIKPFILFLLPIFIAILGGDWYRRIKLLVLGLSPLILVMAINNFSKLTILPLRSIDFLLSLKLSFQHLTDRIYPFVVAYTVIVLSALYTKQKEELFNTLIRYMTMGSLLFYSLAFFHPQFFLLIVPLMVFLIKEDKKFLSLFHVLVLCFFIYTFQWGQDLSWRLFMPINIQFFTNLKAPSVFIGQFYPADKFIGIFRSIFAAVSFWMVYLLMMRKNITISEEDNEHKK